MPHYNLPHNHGQNIEKVLNKMPSAEGYIIFISAAWRSDPAADSMAAVPL